MTGMQPASGPTAQLPILPTHATEVSNKNAQNKEMCLGVDEKEKQYFITAVYQRVGISLSQGSLLVKAVSTHISHEMSTFLNSQHVFIMAVLEHWLGPQN